MRFDLRNQTFHLVFALLAGFGLGLAYAWKVSPVTYVDASPAILRSDFKDQYRVVVAASYISTHDLARARARLELLADTDSVGELSAQAQRMLAAGEDFERVRSIAQLATDLQQGFVSLPFTSTPFAQKLDTPTAITPFIEQPFPAETLFIQEQTLDFELTPLAPAPAFTPTPRPASTAIPLPGKPFALVGQDTVCDASLNLGLLQVILLDARRRQVPGLKIIVASHDGESTFFTGLKPELGNGYADFLMKADTIYSIQIVEGGSFVPDITAPACSDPAGGSYLGGLLLTFQQP